MRLLAANGFPAAFPSLIVLGGGLVAGSLVLIGGDPGIGNASNARLRLWERSLCVGEESAIDQITRFRW
jgi:predicted ATP-dependent serine protease